MIRTTSRSVFCAALFVVSVSAGPAISYDLNSWDEFNPTGLGTVEYLVHIESKEGIQLLCQIDIDWMDTNFRIHHDRTAVILAPHDEAVLRAYPVTGRNGCVTDFNNVDSCGIDQTAFSFKFRVESCSSL